LAEIAVNVENVSKRFRFEGPGGFFHSMTKISRPDVEKSFMALDEITFQVQKGELFGIIGFNGSGKTTLLRTISGIYKPDSGRIQLNGKMCPLLQLGTGFQGELSAKDNIIMNGLLLGLSKQEIESKIDSIIQYAGLEKFSKMKLKHYSSGMRVRLSFSIAMQVDPDILLVDEILAVGDKDFREKGYETFMSLKDKKTILFATHNLPKLREIADRVLLIHKGKQIMVGEPGPVIKKYQQLNSQK